MTVLAKTARQSRTTRRIGLVRYLMVWNEAWKEAQRLKRLDAEAMRDMGLPENAKIDVSVRDIMERMLAR